MLVSAREALSSVESAIGDVRSNESRLDQVLSSATQEAERQRKQLTDSYRSLALVRLDALKRNEAVGELDAAERRALDLLAAHKAKVETLLSRHGEAQKAVANAEEAHRSLTAAAEAARVPIGELQARVEAQMASDAMWTAQRAVVELARKVAEASDAKADQAEADRETKRKPYEADPLFMYLWGRGFATATYKAGNLVRAFDRMVARLVGYETARPNYALLNEIPLRLREHSDVRARALITEDAKLEAIERAALEAAGIVPLEAALAKAMTALEGATKALADHQARLATLDQERQSLINDGDRKAHDEALALLTDAIAREDLQVMYREAQATRSPDDDRIVTAIEAAQKAIVKADIDVAKIRNEMREVARRRGELEGVRDNFRRSRYERPGGQFELGQNEVLGDLIRGVLQGAVQGAVLWALFQRGYRRRDDDDDDDRGGGPWGSGSSGPKFRFPSSGRSGGGGFRTGGGFKGGGGFKTGGRF